MAQGLGYTADLVPTAFGSASQTIFQMTASGACPIGIHRLEVQSALTGSNQAVFQLQAVIASATGSGGGAAVTPRAIVQKNTTAAATAINCGFTTPGAVSLILHTWQWNAATPFDIVLGKDIMVWEIPATKIFALNFIVSPATGTYSGTVTFEEF